MQSEDRSRFPPLSVLRPDVLHHLHEPPARGRAGRAPGPRARPSEGRAHPASLTEPWGGWALSLLSQHRPPPRLLPTPWALSRLPMWKGRSPPAQSPPHLPHGHMPHEHSTAHRPAAQPHVCVTTSGDPRTRWKRGRTQWQHGHCTLVCVRSSSSLEVAGTGIGLESKLGTSVVPVPPLTAPSWLLQLQASQLCSRQGERGRGVRHLLLFLFPENQNFAPTCHCCLGSRRPGPASCAATGVERSSVPYAGTGRG